MKILQKLTATMMMTLLLGVSIASAQFTVNDALSAADLLPGSVDVMYQLNTENQNPLEDLFLELISSDAESELESVFTDNIFTLAMDITAQGLDENMGLPDMFVTFHVPEESFEAMLSLLWGFEEEVPSTDYRGVLVYELETDVFLVYMNDLLIVTSSMDLAEMLVDTYFDGGDTLAMNDVYENAQEFTLGNAFLNMFIDPRFVQESESAIDPLTGELLVDSEGINAEFLSAIIGEEISIAQDDEGFQMSVYVEGDEQKLQNLNMMFDKYNFVPSLFTNVSGQNAVLYMEHNDAEQYIKDLKRTFESDSIYMEMYNEAVAGFNEMTGLDFENDVLTLMGGKNMVVVHSTDQVFPAVTVVLDVSAVKQQAVSAINALSQQLQLDFASNPNYSYDTAQINGTTFHEHVFEDFTLHFATTTDNLLVVSTHPDLSSVFRAQGGMLNNNAFAEFFNSNQTISGVMYLDFQELYAHLRLIMEDAGATAEELLSADEIAAPWKDFYAVSSADGNISWATATLRVDAQNVMASLEGLMTSLQPTLEPLGESETLPAVEVTTEQASGFCDVSTVDWFFDYVTDLASKGIVQGYPDGCFRPSQDVTRAEFLKMAIEAEDYNGAFPWASLTSDDVFFNDVKVTDWYAEYVNQAAANGYAEGYEDGSFRPNESITRAEAVQVLYNMSPEMQESISILPADPDLEGLPFEDVSSGDWFADAVVAAYANDIVSGKTANIFDPNANITRAESAKIVDLFMGL